MGWMSIAAGIAFGLALVLLATFFVTKDARFDRLAEWSFVVFAVLAIPTIWAAGGRLAEGGLVSWAAALIGIASVALIGLGELGSTLGVIDFRRIAPLVSVAFFGFLVWIGIASLLAITAGGLPAQLGWLGIVTIVLGILIVGWILRTPGVMRGERDPKPTQMVAFFVPMIGIVAWMIWLGAVT